MQIDVWVQGKGTNRARGHPETLGHMMPRNWDNIGENLSIFERSWHAELSSLEDYGWARKKPIYHDIVSQG